MENKIETISKRMSVVKGEKDLSIVISAAEPSSKITYSGLLLLVWFISGIIAIVYFFSLTDSAVKTYLLVWLGFWVYFLYVLGKAWMWWKFGSEVIKIKNGRLLIKRDVRGRGFVNDYQLSDVRNIRIGDDNTPSWVKQIGGNFWNIDSLSVGFDTKEKQVTVGYQLSTKERDQLLSLLRAWQKKNAATQ